MNTDVISANATAIEAFIMMAFNFVVSIFGKFIVALIIWIIGKKVINLALKVVDKAFEKANIDKGIAKFLHSALRFICYCFVVLIMIETIGIQTTSLIGVITSCALAIGLSFQGSLSNIAGGLLILIFKPFTIGDYISSTGVEGTVEAIDILYTKLHTVDNKLITIPNGTLSNATVINVGKEDTRRVDVQIGISYDSDIKTAKDILNDIANASKYVLKDKEITIIVTELAASSVNLEVRVWVKTGDYWNAKFELLEQFKTVFDEKGIKIPFNQLDVHINQ